MSILLILATIFFGILSLYNILLWVYLWQLKEYRLDRLWVHIRDTKQGRKTIFSVQALLVFLAIALYVAGIFMDTVNQLFPYIVFLISFILSLMVIQQIVSRKLRRPVLTTKAISISICSVVLLLLLLIFPLTDPFLWIMLLIPTTSLVIALVVFLFSFPTEIYTDMYIQKATEKRKKLKKLQVIAVSGSYGKSSTKEIIAHILQQKFSIAKTASSQNTPLAIAKTILNEVNEKTDFFVVELGAYKKGEIRQLAEMVRPTMSVTTAVSDQHLALYGTMQDVIASEMELVDVLPRGSFVLLNYNSDGVREMAKKIKHMKIIEYKIGNSPVRNRHTAIAYDVKPTMQGVSWKFHYQDNYVSFDSPLLGIHTVENILPAIILALHFGLSVKQVTDAVQTLRPLAKTMEQVTYKKHVTMIDDSFNASPESVVAAVTYAKLFPGRKVIVFSPLIELGKEGKKRHEEVGKVLADMDYVLLTNNNFLPEILQGMKNKKTTVFVGNYTVLARKVKQLLNRGSVCIFEGKEAGIVRNLL